MKQVCRGRKKLGLRGVTNWYELITMNTFGNLLRVNNHIIPMRKLRKDMFKLLINLNHKS